ncbi:MULTISPECIES: AraC family transcriptional regulator [Bacillus]|uniref:AraC family transcriptional regulator n=1 Tax=Bacillus TaxID=1386 RepID=UPI00040CB315|nr:MULTISPECIES: AraC family transcriptional regulator [Bacillus]TFV09853.1 AraC family transcriptional regulator [Bacillus stratosphericus]MCM3365179.1 AraC family transcriptional regulator [Bacillus safensis]MDJ0289956.1 AraC family transcriptional regulator [Bacillus safensis]MEC4587022.1 AraC family transcriptional regulator [Bacillus safensis]MEC4628295.1 AraC family transcriptional regulator [Bacillus safensis]
MDRFITFTVPPFPTYIASGKGVFHQGERHISRTFTVFDLLYVTKGELWMTEGEEAFHVKEGEYTILSPGLSHGGHLPCEEETHYEWLHFSIDRFELTNRLREHWIDMKQNQATFEKPATYEFSLPRLGKVKGRSVLEKHLSAMRALNHGASELPLKKQLLFEELLIHLQKEAFHIPSAKETVASEVVHYLEHHFMEKLHMEQLAEKLHYHPDYMTRCMQTVYGLTPNQYSHRLKIEKAKSMLASTNEKIAAIADHVGIDDPTYFSKLFRQNEGMTPIEYRHLAKRTTK